VFEGGSPGRIRKNRISLRLKKSKTFVSQIMTGGGFFVYGIGKDIKKIFLGGD